MRRADERATIEFTIILPHVKPPYPAQFPVTL